MMKKNVSLILIILSFTFASLGPAYAKKSGAKSSAKVSKKSSKKRVTKKIAVKPSSNIGTDFEFNDSTVHGRYNYSDEALATVENEKMLNRLLGVRTDFKDRLVKESGQN